MDDMEAQWLSFQGVDRAGHSGARSFTNVGVGVEWEPWFRQKDHSGCPAFERFNTLTGGSDLEKVDLLTSNFTVCAELELWRHVWIECSGRHAIGRGNEFLNVRSDLGELYNFREVDLNTQAWMTSMGIKHVLSKDVMARLQWNLWGQSFGMENQSQLLASQVFIVISANL